VIVAGTGSCGLERGGGGGSEVGWMPVEEYRMGVRVGERYHDAIQAMYISYRWSTSTGMIQVILLCCRYI